MSIVNLEPVSRAEDDPQHVAANEPERLCPGDNLSRAEFVRIWEQLPSLKLAELIEGIVYMPSPLSRKHSEMASLLTGWIFNYQIQTPGCKSGANGTWFMLDSVPQPDVALRVLPEFGGQSAEEGKYVSGAPELAIEVAYSTASYDLHQKLKLYCKAGVREYLVVIQRRPEIRWHKLVDGQFQLIAPDAAGIYRSLVFPGLWLNGPALLRDDANAVMATLQDGLQSPEHAEFVKLLETRNPKDKSLQPPAAH